MTNPADADKSGVCVPSMAAFLRSGLAVYGLTSWLVVLGVVVGHHLGKAHSQKMAAEGQMLAFANYDGRWYQAILEDGYTYDPDGPSRVAFFPAYPLAGRAVALVTGLPSEYALLLVTHLSLAGAFVVMAAYLQRRREPPSKSTLWVLLAMGLLPTTFFFRMAYSEALFLLLGILTLYGCVRDWPLIVIALIIGLATATRAVGVVLLAPLLLHIWGSSSSGKIRALNLAVYLPLACWGIAGFMLFQWLAFDDPLAFVKTQNQWRLRSPTSPGEKALSLALLEPVWTIFVPDSECWWKTLDTKTSPVFSLYVANPIFFVGTCVLIVVGKIKGWINGNEFIVAVGLLLVPYLTRSHEMGMISMGRFAAAAFPVYLVLGHILGRIPRSAAVLLLAFSSFYLVVYSMFFGFAAKYFY